MSTRRIIVVTIDEVIIKTGGAITTQPIKYDTIIVNHISAIVKSNIDRQGIAPWIRMKNAILNTRPVLKFYLIILIVV